MSQISLPASEAAEKIRADFSALEDMPPETRYVLSYVGDVCGALGVEANAFNIDRVSDLLNKNGIELHTAKAYPKTALDKNGDAIYDDSGVPILFQNEQEERMFVPPPPKPELENNLTFVKNLCANMGIRANSMNLQRVAQFLHDNNIRPGA